MKLKLLSHILRDIKRFFIIQSYRFIPLVRWWYGLTMRLTKIYTRTGDQGKTRLANGEEVSKQIDTGVWLVKKDDLEDEEVKALLSLQ